MPSSKEKLIRQSETGKPSAALVHEFELSLASRDTQHETRHVLFSPMHYESGYAYPLILWLHGRGKTDERQLMKVMPVVSMRNYVGIAPRGLPCAWENAGESLGWGDSDADFFAAQKRVFDCLEIARKKCHINKKRIFLVGCHEGGTMAFQLGLQFPNVFAGVVSLGGPFPRGNLGQFHAVRKLPFLLSVGRESKDFSASRLAQDMRLFHAAGMSVTVRQYPGSEPLSVMMLEDVNRWLMERITR
ncbi:MAG: hypothetical protein LBQ54_12740 [Planctomycetaceae bacterium]|jgi:phospholipase/carboxylesterase|nr:hypothetical protein [Planctomycetaceae bacterium]